MLDVGAFDTRHGRVSAFDPRTLRLTALDALIMFQSLPQCGREDESFIKPGLWATFCDAVRLLAQVSIELDPDVQRRAYDCRRLSSSSEVGRDKLSLRAPRDRRYEKARDTLRLRSPPISEM